MHPPLATPLRLRAGHPVPPIRPFPRRQRNGVAGHAVGSSFSWGVSRPTHGSCPRNTREPMLMCCPPGGLRPRQGVCGPVGTTSPDRSGLRTDTPSIPVASTPPGATARCKTTSRRCEDPCCPAVRCVHTASLLLSHSADPLKLQGARHPPPACSTQNSCGGSTPHEFLFVRGRRRWLQPFVLLCLQRGKKALLP